MPAVKRLLFVTLIAVLTSEGGAEEPRQLKGTQTAIRGAQNGIYVHSSKPVIENSVPTGHVVGIYAGEYGSSSHPSLRNCLKLSKNSKSTRWSGPDGIVRNDRALHHLEKWRLGHPRRNTMRRLRFQHPSSRRIGAEAYGAGFTRARSPRAPRLSQRIRITTYPTVHPKLGIFRRENRLSP